jgi:alkylated DNA repair dioxygenase AlkB
MLFPVEPQFPPGFRYEREFLSREEERDLLARFSELPFRNSAYHQYTALRRSAHFGLRWDYGRAQLTDAPPAPPFLRQVAAMVASHLRRPVEDFAHVLVIEYPPGAPMGWHRDAPPFAVIHGISLGSHAEFRLRPNAEHLRTKENTIRFTAERRSLYVMAGESRSQWQHSLPPVKQTRYSITLRTMR